MEIFTFSGAPPGTDSRKIFGAFLVPHPFRPLHFHPKGVFAANFRYFTLALSATLSGWVALFDKHVPAPRLPLFFRHLFTAPLAVLPSLFLLSPGSLATGAQFLRVY